MHKMNLIGYYHDDVNPPEMKDYNYSHCFFQNRSEIIYCVENIFLYGFMISQYDDKILIAYGVGKKSISSCATVTFKDKTNHQNKFGVYFSVKVMENDINRIPKSHIVQSISRYVALLPYCCCCECSYSIKMDVSVGNPEFCRDLYN